MKVLWLCNVVLPELADVFGFKKEKFGGWLTGAWKELNKVENIELAVCVPVRNPERVHDGEYNAYKYYSFLTISNESDTDINEQVIRFKELLDDFNPDIIHIWGTEYEHSYSMTKAACEIGIADRIVVNIQGLLTFCEKVFEYRIPETVATEKINGKTIREERLSFLERSKYEQYVLTQVNQVIGRTDWDRASTKEINPKLKYYYCGEILRDKFYLAQKWNSEKCQKHSIFISQAFYPIKGFHLVLDEIKRLSIEYPDLMVYVAGPDVSKSDSGYANYIRQRIDDLGIHSKIIFLGLISEEQIVEEYLRANVFLSASVIENSSNSVCEAMMIGTPVVSSYVGGMASLVSHGVSGYMYPLTEPSLMRHYIEKIFDGDINLSRLSQKEIESANRFNNREDAVDRMISIYKEIAEEGE